MTFNLRRLAVLGLIASALALVPTAAVPAAPVRSSLSLDQVAPHHGDTVTFTSSPQVDVAPDWPWIEVWCFQGNQLVYAAGAQYYFTTPLADSFTLSSGLWDASPGEAACTATLYVRPNNKPKALASVSFTALA